jgi:hypothetical protein
VLSFPFPLRFLFGDQPAIMSQVLGIVYRAIAPRLMRKARKMMRSTEIRE